ncbi:jg21505 [Pararge aegeria aegeria]|uniref:Jg21505 protein n=1 Tax=Pararge aegeria aegeria TaxID=348720 RepID=A0A8S4RQY8_9NEOP|nr:jg21505 [Pararge aegeria aegeria]
MESPSRKRAHYCASIKLCSALHKVSKSTSSRTKETGDVTCSGKMRLPSKANRLNERDWSLKSIMDEGAVEGDPGGARWPICD